MEDEAITEFVRLQLTLPNKLDPSDELNWQHHLYSTLGNKDSAIGSQMKPEALDFLIKRIVAMGKVLYGLHMVSALSQACTLLSAFLVLNLSDHSLLYGR